MDATGILWSMRNPMSPVVQHAATLTGADPASVGAAHLVEIASSDAAGAVIDTMGRLDRVLTSTQRSRTEVCVHSVRGPIAWSETMTARANALGNEDVFVCRTSERSFDTVGNRLAVHCLRRLVEADDRMAEEVDVVDDPVRDLVRHRAEAARSILGLVVLERLADRVPSQRELARLRAGRRAREFGPMLTVAAAYADGPSAGLLVGLSDPPTLRYHEFVLEVTDQFVSRGSMSGSMRFAGGQLVAGAMTFRHPARPGPGVPGLAFRGIPLLPRPELVADARWAADLPASGRLIASPSDVTVLIEQVEAGRD